MDQPYRGTRPTSRIIINCVKVCLNSDPCLIPSSGGWNRISKHIHDMQDHIRSAGWTCAFICVQEHRLLEIADGWHVAVRLVSKRPVGEFQNTFYLVMSTILLLFRRDDDAWYWTTNAYTVELFDWGLAQKMTCSVPVLTKGCR